MNTNLLTKELKDGFKGTLITTVTVVSYFVLIFYAYSTMKENMSRVVELYSFFPESLRVALNINLDQWSNVLGSYVTYFIYLIPLAAGCYSIILGTTLLSKEEQNKTAEFLLSRPISRGQIISSKLMAFFIHILGINIIVFITSFLGCGIVSDWNFKLQSLLFLHIYGLLICIFFGILGFFITVLMKRAKAITGIGIGIVLGTYFFDMMIRTSGKVQFLLYFTPYKYLNLDVLSEDYGFEAWRLLFFFGTSGLLIFLSYYFYKKKDILV